MLRIGPDREFLGHIFNLFFMSTYAKTKLFGAVPNSRLPANFQLNILIFVARISLQTLLQSLKQKDRKSAQICPPSSLTFHKMFSRFLTTVLETFQSVYGTRLIIQRSVSASGGGSYRLKNEKGKIVADRRVREEISRMLSCFNVQLNNPIAILPQDTAKTMLFSLKPDKLYEFFMKATQLEELYRYFFQRLLLQEI